MRQFAAISMHPKSISIRDFTYTLPDEKIARYPLSERDASKLLVYRNGHIEQTFYKEIDQYLPQNSLLVLNDTKVVAARILFHKPTGAEIEIFCLEPGNGYVNLTAAMLQSGNVEWLCLIGGASKWKHGQVLKKKVEIGNEEVLLEARFLRKVNSNFAVRISWTPSRFTFSEVLQASGSIPLPPYLKRAAEESDHDRYQTVYGRSDGSVAAPTAGLHFTDFILKKLLDRLEIARVTLHVGAGTFKPVKAEILEQHEMHAEFIDVDISSIQKIKNHSTGFITAVGTTSLRTIESLYWMGVKAIYDSNISPENIMVRQWDPYEISADEITAPDALNELILWMEKSDITRLVTKTQIMIAPGYKMKLASGLVTNFHQPQSTLLLLIAAFIGEDWRNVYEYALQNQFRFLSYGDGCLLFRNGAFP